MQQALPALQKVAHGLDNGVVFGLAGFEAQLGLLDLELLHVGIGLGELEFGTGGPQLGQALLVLAHDLEFEVVGLDVELGELLVLAADVAGLGPPVHGQGKAQVGIEVGDQGVVGLRLVAAGIQGRDRGEAHGHGRGMKWT